MDDEVELRVALRAVEDQVDVRVDTAIDDAPVHRHVRPPRAGIGARVVVRLARLRLRARDARGGSSSEPTDADRLGGGVLAGPGSRRDEPRAVQAQPQALAGCVGHVAHVRRRLADVWLEGQGQP
jgi:hypothetical protein